MLIFARYTILWSLVLLHDIAWCSRNGALANMLSFTRLTPECKTDDYEPVQDYSRFCVIPLVLRCGGRGRNGLAAGARTGHLA